MERRELGVGSSDMGWSPESAAQAYTETVKLVRVFPVPILFTLPTVCPTLITKTV